MLSVNDVKSSLLANGVGFFVNSIAQTVKYKGSYVNGVEKYYALQQAFGAWDGTYGRNDFCDRFKNFYAMDGRLCTEAYFNEFFSQLNSYRNGPIRATNFGNALDIYVLVSNKLYNDASLYRKNPVHHCSFISKLTHTLYDGFPIYDSKVRRVLDLEDISLCAAPHKIQNSKLVLMQMHDLYTDCSADQQISGFVDDVYGALCAAGNITNDMLNNMSFVKKLDFILWCL